MVLKIMHFNHKLMENTKAKKKERKKNHAFFFFLMLLIHENTITYTLIYDGKMANYCQKSKAAKQKTKTIAEFLK